MVPQSTVAAATNHELNLQNGASVSIASFLHGK